MKLKLKTVVLRMDSSKVGTGVIGTEAIGIASATSSAPSTRSLSVETQDLSDGERDEVASESNAVSVGIAMPFTLIEPTSGADGDDDEGDSWSIADIGADGLDNNAGAGIKIAVLDTGIATDHPAFDGLEVVTENFTDDVPEDINGHGTRCAGTIFGQNVDGRLTCSPETSAF